MATLARIGSEFLVNNETAANQEAPTITGLANGGFVISWTDWSGTLGDTSFTSIKAQMFSADGAKVGTEFLVNTQTFDRQRYSTVTPLANGGFVIAWEDWASNSQIATWGVTAQVFSANGAKVGTEFLVNTQTNGPRGYAAVAGLSNGGFVVSWMDQSGALGDSSGFGIAAQVFNADGSKSGGEFLVNSETDNHQFAPKVVGLANDGFVITWTDESLTLGDSSGYSIKGQVFGAGGAKIGGEFLVNTQTNGTQCQSSIAQISGGGFVISWWDDSGTLGDNNGTSIKAQIFSADGNKIGSEFLVNTETASSQWVPTVTTLTNGCFVITWHDFSGTLGDSSESSIKAQVFSSDGTKIGTEFLVNTQTSGLQLGPTISGLATGGFVISWSDYSGTLGDIFGSSIKAQVFSFITGSRFLGSADLDRLMGTAGGDVLNGLGGIDSMDGKDDADVYIITGSGEHKAAEIQDTGATGTDEVRFSAARSDTLKIFAGDTGIERVVIGTGTDATADSSGTLSLSIDASKAVNGLTIIGNAGVNKLIGTAFSDTIDGGAGADKMTGGAGDDTYIVDNVKDVIAEKAAGGTDAVMASTGYTLSSNVENLTLTGTANIGGTGNSAANIIVGNDGNNTLNGAEGNDTLTGGAGADVFGFSAKANAATNVDTITDFSHSDGDHIQFSLKQFKALGAVADLTSDQFWSGAGVTTAHDATDRLVYNTTSGDLYYDADGTGAKAAVLVAHLSGSPTLSYSDIQIIA